MSSARRRSPSKRKSAPTTTSSRKTRRSSRPIGSPSKRKSSKRDSASSPLAYLGLGSNVGDRRAHLEAALREIAGFAKIRRVSSFYRTEPVGFADQRDFWNAAAEIAWPGTPGELLAEIRRVEQRVGRVRTFVNGPREIDVDILDIGGKRRDHADPVLPHPRLADRRFALAPLAEIRPDWVDPRSGVGIAEMLGRLPSRPRVTRIRDTGERKRKI